MQSRIKKILVGIAKSGRVASAYLFVGPAGSGKQEAAENFASLLEVSRQDRFFLEPQGSSLKIEQVRELQKWVRYGPSNGRYLLVVVAGADLLTDQAAAAFLKTLEEPSPGVVFVLLAERQDKILPTIASRCQKLLFAKRELKQSVAELPRQFQGISQKSIVELLQLSASLEKDRDSLEDSLYSLARQLNYRGARIVLDSLRCLKRRANLRLTLDNMCLQLGEI